MAMKAAQMRELTDATLSLEQRKRAVGLIKKFEEALGERSKIREEILLKIEKAASNGLSCISLTFSGKDDSYVDLIIDVLTDEELGFKAKRLRKSDVTIVTIVW